MFVKKQREGDTKTKGGVLCVAGKDKRDVQNLQRR